MFIEMDQTASVEVTENNSEAAPPRKGGKARTCKLKRFGDAENPIRTALEAAIVKDEPQQQEPAEVFDKPASESPHSKRPESQVSQSPFTKLSTIGLISKLNAFIYYEHRNQTV